jgi:hypothetical protein
MKQRNKRPRRVRNTSKKGSHRVTLVKAILEPYGYACTVAAASKSDSGEDLVGWGRGHAVQIQCKSNERMPPRERQKFEEGCPPYAIRYEVVVRDGKRIPGRGNLREPPRIDFYRLFEGMPERGGKKRWIHVDPHEEFRGNGAKG